ncbi:sugar transferase [Peptoclostridium acidaminophilum DSM 3953]|uniref:Sugar transferase n=1 Tax=Peptoclostridium acidaminophilum DSM 3953 TaxID=1286171 RepID=W8TH86_PEPAC|nr:sugar transferase [Peptoclostridium acidaminophilum]AHM57173.1 sugar transferase [Peptoclostridium acidaminophilum DSM 3953]
MDMRDSETIIKMSMISLEKKFVYQCMKRIMDIIGSIFGIIFFSPLCLLIMLAVKLDDPKGDIFYGHERIGRDGRTFKCWKFRTMLSNAKELFEQFTPEQKKEYEENFKLKDDPRITRLGSFLRTTSMDELPQFYNILRGDMSLVGPRPIVQAELEKYGEFQEIYKCVRPGLTGMWQVMGRSDTTYEQRISMDVEYVNSMSVFLDIRLIFLTVVKVIKKEGAY